MLVSILKAMAWIGEHLREILIVCAALVVLRLILSARKRSKLKQAVLHQQERERREREEARRREEERARAAEEEARRKAEREKKEEEAAVVQGIYKVPDFTQNYNGFGIAYNYPDVAFDPVPGGHAFIQSLQPLSFDLSGEKVQICQGDHLIGTMRENRLAGMVRDWTDDNLPVLASVVKYAPDDSFAQMAMCFYQDLLEQFRSGHDDHKIVKLSGTPDDLFEDPAPGTKCSVEYDPEHDKYSVSLNDSFIGFLPESALSFAEDHGVDPDALAVVYAETDSDSDPVKYSVCIAADSEE